jgi:hypothetical protein
VTRVPPGGETHEKDDGDSRCGTPAAASFGSVRRWSPAGVCRPDYGSQKTVSAASECFNEAGIFGGITEGVAQALDGGVQAVVEIHEGVGRPEPAPQLFPGKNFTGTLEEHGQDLERLLLESHLSAVPPEFTGAEIHFEGTKADDAVFPLVWHE